MSSRDSRSRLQEMGSSKRRTQRRTINSVSKGGAIFKSFQESCQSSSHEELLKIDSTFESEAHVRNSSLTRKLAQEISSKKSERFIVFIGKSTYIDQGRLL